jgi:hypothetical protein
LGERNYIEPGPGCDVHDDPRWQMMMIGNCVLAWKGLMPVAIEP